MKLGLMRMLLVMWIFTSSVIVIDAALIPRVALAQNGSIGRIENKLEDVASLLERLGLIGVGIAVLFVGFKFLQGDPHAWRYAMFLVLGAAIIFGSSEVVSWLQS